MLNNVIIINLSFIIFRVENFIATINFELLGNKSRETFAQEVSSSM